MDLIQVYGSSSSSSRASSTSDDDNEDDAAAVDHKKVQLYHKSNKKKRKRSSKESCCSCSNESYELRQKALEVSLVSIDDDSLGNRSRNRSRDPTTTNRSSNNGGMHFKRSQPHVIGNWSGHLYLKVNIPEHSHDANSSYGRDHEYGYGELKNVILNTLDHFVMTMNCNCQHHRHCYCYPNVPNVPLHHPDQNQAVVIHSSQNNPALPPENKQSQRLECGISDGGGNISSSRNAVEKVMVVSHIPMHRSNTLANKMHQDSSLSSSSSSSSSLESNHDCTSTQNECQQHHLHISLSRPFYLQKQSIESFITDLKKLIAVKVQYPIRARIPISRSNLIHQAACACTCTTTNTTIPTTMPTTTNASTQGNDLGNKSISVPTAIQIPKVEILSNDEKTRSFLTIPLQTDEMTKKDQYQCVTTTTTTIANEVGIPRIVDIIDIIMAKYGQEKYYQDPKFHISIASWHYNEGIVEKWQDYCQRRQCVHGVQRNGNDGVNDDDGESNDGLRGSDAMLSIVLRGMHCDFGTVEKHFIPFG